LPSPTTTIGSQFVGHWDAVPAHWHNTNGSRAYVPSGTAITSQPSRIEFVPLAGLRIQGWPFVANITDGDFWNFGTSPRKPPGGLVAAFYFADKDDDLDDWNAVRCTRPDLIEFNGNGVTGSGFVITLSRGTNTRGGPHPIGTGGGNNISPTQQGAANKIPVGSVPLHILSVGGYAGAGVSLMAGPNRFHSVPAESLRWQCYYFSAINNNQTWTSADTIPPPKGMVTAAWMGDNNSGGLDIVTPRLTSANEVLFRSTGIDRNGWLLVGCR
jgi:hypothetical protein